MATQSNVTHTFISAKAEGSDTSLVGPNEWNADHTIYLACSNKISPASSDLLITGGTVVGYGAIVSAEYEITSGNAVEIGSLATLEIL